MRRRTRSLASVLAPLALVGVLLAGCGSDAEDTAGPEDASTSAFCSAWSSLDVDAADDTEATDQILDTGTPSGMGKQARRGYEAIVGALESGDADNALDALDEVDDDEATDLAAFLSYLTTTCAEDSSDG
ncbi:hypothetical protein [Nocardioides bruguierae]|uniref:hypothetical protein n=1 Tax=Nocardioides bruguierae TaxID=2945102 RepID=UPI002022164A|nr:hypothetical protein [Nocardioides bruguierae]MCL8026794.1 hypothetical protein [Nocardioides bruguierae]